MAIDPVALSLFGLDIRWYGITYVLGFLFSYFFILYYSKEFGIKKEIAEDIFFYLMIFSVLGGRVFYILFYNPLYYLMNPLEIFFVWQGGMSIHGGIIGAFLTLYYHSKKYKIHLFDLTDLFLIPTALGLAFGRLANFVNQELVGTVTKSNLGIVFPLHDDQTRWPYQIFAAAKNMLTFQVMYFLFIFKKLRKGTLTAIFMIMYSFGRFFLDFIRVPTVDLGIISMGQLLNLVFGLVGIYILYMIYKKEKKEKKKK